MKKLEMFSPAFLVVDRRAFLGAAAVAGGVSAAGVAGAAPAPNPQHAEPDLVDATSNAPSYWAHPAKAGRKVIASFDPTELALKI